MIIPSRKTRYLQVERVRAKWHQNDAHAFVLESQDESFEECNTPVLANGAEVGCDPLAITPILVYAAPELLARVEDDVFGVGTCVVDGCSNDNIF